MIPKRIHYCWFGRNPKPKLAEKCIKSWKKHCPDYEIKEWNEDNFDISEAPLYVQQAYESKKWAFVTDYVRLWAMVNYGGIYMDTDVEVIKSLDAFLKHDAFSGFESKVCIPTGIMSCKKGFPLFEELLHEYDSIPFILSDGSFDMTTNVTRITNHCSKYGFVSNGEYQIIKGFALYPSEYFCPKDFSTGITKKTKNTYTIHHFNASWHSEEQRKKTKIRQKNAKKEIYKDLIVHAPNIILRKAVGDKIYDRIKKQIKG